MKINTLESLISYKFNSVLRWRKWKDLRFLIQFIMYVGSLATLTALYYTRSGKFQFKAHLFADWVIIIVIIVFIVVGITYFFGDLDINQIDSIPRKSLNNVLDKMRREAVSSITIFGGDLSWLNSSRESLKLLNVTNPNVSVTIYYDDWRVTNAANMIGFEKFNIAFIPYPIRMKRKVGVTLIDKDSNPQVYEYLKVKQAPITKSRDHDTFDLRRYTDHTSLSNAVICMDQLIEQVQSKRRFITFTGCNNIGKTSLIRKLQRVLTNKGYKVYIINDVFKETFGQRSVISNLNCLTNQLIRENAATESALYLLDRSVIDYYCYIHILNQTELQPDTLSSLRHSIINYLTQYEEIYHIQQQPFKENLKTTKHIDGDRKKYHVCLKTFLKELDRGCRRITFNTRKQSLDRCIDIAIKSIVRDITY